MPRLFLFFVALSLVLISLASGLYATPYWTPADQQRFLSERDFWMLTDRVPLAFNPQDYSSLIYEYVQICDFQVIMQELDPVDRLIYGGMHEGETSNLWAIIETDNTQEAIRVWSTYALLSGDLETYRSNIAAAWYYTLNNPAYSEEGAPGEDYYRVHNCGWALVAESRYRQVYGDSTYLDYADSCAAYLETHRLPYTGTWAILNPLVEGWAAGTLYDYGVAGGDSTAILHALAVGADVKAWIEANPNRLNNNEDWAMCGGTALWGVCRSVFTSDTLAGQNWLPQYLPYLDTFQPAFGASWNSSWNVWYAHAWHASHALLNDSLSAAHALALVDTLLDGDTDEDGGIMANSNDPPTADQSWVSCYLDYMGLEALLAEIPQFDAAAIGFLDPAGSLPIAQGEPQPVNVLVANSGIQPFGTLTIHIGGAFTATASTYLDFAELDTVYCGSWTPQATGLVPLTMSLENGGAISANDTASTWVEVLGWGTIQGEVSDAITFQPLAASISCYRDGFPPNLPQYTGTTNPATGQYQISVIEGRYRVVVDPQIPYTDRAVDSVLVEMGSSAEVDFTLFPAPLLLVDDDLGDTLESFFLAAFDSVEYDAYHWDSYQNGPPLNELELFNAVIWFTGRDSLTTLEVAEQQALSTYLNNGKPVLLTGQNIAQDLQDDPYLEAVLKTEFLLPNSGQFMVNGVTGDTVTSGMVCYFIGGGVNNQISTDVILPVSPAVGAMVYPNGDTAAVRLEEPYKLLFLGFGLEGVTGINNTTSRGQFLLATLQWFGVDSGIAGVPTQQPPPTPPQIGLSPNPFNPEVQVSFNLREAGNTRFEIYNIQGQNIESLDLGTLNVGAHTVRYRFPQQLGSGVYFMRVTGKNIEIVTKGILLR